MKIRPFPRVRQGLVAALLAAAIALFSSAVQIRRSTPAISHAGIADSSVEYAGSAACARCHPSLSATHSGTAHFRTSGWPGDSSIKGSFETRHNRFAFNDSFYISMEKRKTGFYQTLYANGEEQVSRRFDLVVGSGTKGQTYLYYDEDYRLFQLPISFFTPANTWSNSPGFPGVPIFTRPVTARCLECHTTGAVPFGTGDGQGEPSFNPEQLMPGIGCERCHGPAKAHVLWHDAHPTDSSAHDMVSLAGFSRQQKLDLCRFCHGGIMPARKPAFTYLPGDRLADYFITDSAARNPASIDVHGNQYGLLSASACFRSGLLTCNSCHDPHRTERDANKLFSSRCQSCHQPGHDAECKLTGKADPAVMVNCIDCHMPKQSSKAIMMYLPGESSPTPARMRTHRIAVYPDATEQVLAAASPGNPIRLNRVFDRKSGQWRYER